MKLLIIACIAVAVTGCANLPFQDTGEGIVPPPVAPESDIYRIGAGDVLTVSVWGNADLSLTVPVRPDGYISLPLVGDIKANERDAESLGADITEALSSQLRNPLVTVIVSQVNSVQYTTRVRVTGAVMAPRSLPHARGMSVLDAILEAGGVNEVASANRAKLYRTVDGSLQEFELRLDDILLRGDLTTNYQMQPGDVISVPERLF